MLLRIKLYFSLIVAALLIIINHYAIQYSAYWIFNWFDIPMHIFGGIMAGFFAYTAIDYINDKQQPSINNLENKPHAGIFIKRKKLVVLGFVLLVGIVWEIIEMFYGVGGLSVEYRLNTIKDIFDDVLGGGLSILIWNFLFVKNNKNNDK